MSEVIRNCSRARLEKNRRKCDFKQWMVPSCSSYKFNVTQTKWTLKQKKQNTLVLRFFLIRALCAISWREHPQPAKKDQFDVLTARGQSCAREYNDSSFPPYGFKITISSCSKTNITQQRRPHYSEIWDLSWNQLFK